jgi:GAF domain-containing protein
MARKRRFNSHEAHFLQSIADVLAEAIMRRQLEEELLPIPPVLNTAAAWDCASCATAPK